jgi:hypothetical protein
MKGKLRGKMTAWAKKAQGIDCRVDEGSTGKRWQYGLKVDGVGFLSGIFSPDRDDF